MGSGGSAGSGGAFGGGGNAGGTAGASGGAGEAGTAGSGGTAPQVGWPFTFPQNERSAYCSYPTMADPEHARTAYQRWKDELVTADGAGGYLRVRRPGTENDTTVSEGIAYGMIFAVVMDDQPLFDALWKYSQQYVNERGLMHWQIDAGGTVIGHGAATDADEDMAWALALAEEKWGGSGSLDEEYGSLARAQIQRIWDHEVNHEWGDLLVAGDSWPHIVFNPSYFAPNQYRLFGKLTDNEEGWNRVIDKGYEVLMKSLDPELGNAENGLAPAWTDAEGRPTAAFDGAPTHYQYDSARIPFRIGQDYCAFGEPRAKAYLDKVSAFFSAVGASGIVDGYELDGTPRPENPDAQAALFVGAAAVGAMSDPLYAPLMNEGYQLLVTKEMLPPSYYFNLCWQVFSLLMMTGNLFDYTLYP